MSGIDFARSYLSLGLLCELVLKDEFTFQISASEIFPKTWGGGHSYIIEDMELRIWMCVRDFQTITPLQTKILAKFWTLCRQMVEHFRKYIPYFPGLPPLLELAPLLGFSIPHKTSNFDKCSCLS